MTATNDLDRMLESWLNTAGPTDLRPGVVDDALATARRARRHGGLRAAIAGPRPWPRQQPAPLPIARRATLILVVIALLAVVVAVVGSAGRLQMFRADVRPSQSAPSETGPAGPLPDNRFVITDTTGPCPAPGNGTTSLPGAILVDVAAGTTDRLLACETGLLLSPDAIHAVASVGGHLELIDLGDGTRAPIPDAEGLEPEAIAWSPRGTYLHWLGQNIGGSPTLVFLGPTSDARRTQLPTPSEGGYTGVTWSADERRMMIEVDDGWLSGNGDGTDLRPLADPQARVLSMSSDGESLAYAVDRVNQSGALVAVDVATGDPFAAPELVTDFPDGTHATHAAWSPDDSVLAVVGSSRPDPAAPSAATSNDLWLIARDGTTRHFDLPAADDGVRGDGAIRWAPDGAHLAVGWHTLRRNAQGLETHTDQFLIMSASDGALVGADGWTSGALRSLYFSPDGESAAYQAGATLNIVELDGSGTTSLRTIVTFGPGQEVVWQP